MLPHKHYHKVVVVRRGGGRKDFEGRSEEDEFVRDKCKVLLGKYGIQESVLVRLPGKLLCPPAALMKIEAREVILSLNSAPIGPNGTPSP